MPSNAVVPVSAPLTTASDPVPFDIIALIALTGAKADATLAPKEPAMAQLERRFEDLVAHLNVLKSQQPPNKKAIKDKEVGFKSQGCC